MASALTVAGRDTGGGVAKFQGKHPHPTLSGAVRANPLLRRAHTHSGWRTLRSQSQRTHFTDRDAELAPDRDTLTPDKWSLISRGLGTPGGDLVPQEQCPQSTIWVWAPAQPSGGHRRAYAAGPSTFCRPPALAAVFQPLLSTHSLGKESPATFPRPPPKLGRKQSVRGSPLGGCPGRREQHP